MAQKRAAVLLAGCGVYDGAEIMESTAAVFSLHEFGFEVSFFAPNWDQMHVVNHATGQPVEQTRNCLEEAGRIARGNIKPLDQLRAEDFEALILPGGFGVVKNYSDFIQKGDQMTVRPEIEKVLLEFHQHKRVIAASCIAPLILARVFKGSEITLGCKGEGWQYQDTIDVAVKVGAQHIETANDKAHVDLANRLVTAPAFMYEFKNYFHLYQNMRTMIVEVDKLLTH